MFGEMRTKYVENGFDARVRVGISGAKTANHAVDSMVRAAYVNTSKIAAAMRQLC